MTVDICLSKSSISLKCYRFSKVHIRSTDVCVKCWFDIYYKYYWNRIFAGSALWNVFLSHIDGERKSDSKKPFQFLKYISSRLQSSTLRLFFAIWHFLFLFLKANSSEEEMNVSNSHFSILWSWAGNFKNICRCSPEQIQTLSAQDLAR